MSVSLVEVSKVAGVSKSTVSRVLNHDPRVSDDAVRAVQEAVKRLGYSRPEGMGRPRRAPSGLAKGSVALIFPDTNPAALKTVLSGRLLHGIEEVFRGRGVNLVIAGLPGADRLPQAVEQRQVDGVLIRGSAPESSRKSFIDGLGRLPCVLIFAPRGQVSPAWSLVLEDNDAIGGLALDYLQSHDATRVGFLNTQPDHPSFRQRKLAFFDRAEAAGVPAFAAASATATAEELVRELFETAGGKLDGLFVPGTDDTVVAVYRVLRGMGLRVGSDIQLISCNNDPVRLATLDPELANIDINAEAIGRAAAEMLLWRLTNPKDPARRLTVAPRLVDPRADAPPAEPRPAGSRVASA